MFKFSKITYKNKTDESLMEAICNGDTEAFSELYKRYKHRLLYYFFRMLSNDNEIAQDFLQELFLKIIDKPYLFDTSKKFSTWIFSMAHNMCKNEYRSREVRSILHKVQDTDCFCDDKPSEKEFNHTADDVFNCLESFDSEYSSVFLLKYREGLSIDEISEVLELATGTVKSRLHYMRKNIRKMLEGEVLVNN